MGQEEALLFLESASSYQLSAQRCGFSLVGLCKVAENLVPPAVQNEVPWKSLLGSVLGSRVRNSKMVSLVSSTGSGT